MEAHGIPGEIQVTEATYEILKPQYHFEERGLIDIKDKGPMKTYLLRGKMVAVEPCSDIFSPRDDGVG